MIEYKNTTFELILSSNEFMDIYLQEVKHLFDLLRRLKLDMSVLSTLEFVETTNNNYTFTLNTIDLRNWVQHLQFFNNTDSNPKISYTTDLFEREEYIIIRLLRDHVIELINKFYLTQLEVTYY